MLKLLILKDDPYILVLKVTKFCEDWLNRFWDIQKNPQGGHLPPPPVQIGLKILVGISKEGTWYFKNISHILIWYLRLLSYSLAGLHQLFMHYSWREFQTEFQNPWLLPSHVRLSRLSHVYLRGLSRTYREERVWSLILRKATEKTRVKSFRLPIANFKIDHFS